MKCESKNVKCIKDRSIVICIHEISICSTEISSNVQDVETRMLLLSWELKMKMEINGNEDMEVLLVN